MTNCSRTTRIDLQEVSMRNRAARTTVATARTSELPPFASFLQRIDTALADIPTLVKELVRLDTVLNDPRRDLADLAAAARAALAAHADHEADALWYLRDELHYQGYPT